MKPVTAGAKKPVLELRTGPPISPAARLRSMRSAKFKRTLEALVESINGPRNRARARAMDRLSVYKITEAEVLDALGPSPDERLMEVSALPHVEALLKKYREALPIAHAVPIEGDHEEIAAIRASIARLEEKRTSILELAQKMKLGPRKKWNVPPSRFWTMPMNEVRRSPRFYGKVEKWELVGDRIVALYDLIASRVHSQRRQRREAVPRAVYNQNAMRLTAETVSDMWVSVFGLSPFSKPLTADDVRNRLSKRADRRS